MTPPILGLDIGGANLKAATSDRRAAAVAFPLWKHPDRLPAVLADLVAPFADCEGIALTMTGELCDCFETKRDGVRAIVAAVRNVSRSRPIHVWGTDGRFRNSEEALADHLAVASANWHALAMLAGNYVPRGVGLLIDIGSTTTDLIPLLDGQPWAEGKTDTARLRLGELVYTGVRRTPATTLLGPGYAAELFATTLDAYLLLGETPEDPDDCDTADGRPATRNYSHARLSRMVCGDPELTPCDDTLRLARQIADRQRELVRGKVEALVPRLRELRYSALHPQRVAVLSGSGEFLARQLVRRRGNDFDDVLSLGERLGPELSACAPAYAVAVLAAERRP